MDVERRITREHLWRFHERYGHDPIVYAPFAYDAVHLIAKAMIAAGSARPSDYLPYLAKSDVDAVTGKIQFDSKGDLIAGGVTFYTYVGARRQPIRRQASGATR